MSAGSRGRAEPVAGSWRAVWLFVLVGILVGLLHAFPNLWYPVALGRDFRGLPLWNSQDELDRLAAVRAVRNGDYELKNLYFAEEAMADRPPSAKSAQIVPYILSSWLLRAVGDSPQRFVVTTKVFFPAILSVLVAWWTAAMSRSVWLGVATGAAAVLLPTLWCLDFFLFEPQAWWSSHLIFMRPGTHVAALVWAGALVAWERDLVGVRSRWPVTAVLLSLVVYSYFFYWSLTLLLLAVFAVLSWRSGQREWARRTVLAVAGCVVLSGYAWLEMARSSKSALWTVDEFGGAWNHAPCLSLFQVFVVGFVVLAWRARRCGLLEQRGYLMVMAFGLAHIIAMNQQVVTGVVLESHHYEWFVSPVLLTVLLAVCLHRIGEREGGWEILRRDLVGLIRRAPVVTAILSAAVLLALLVGLAGPAFPRPAGGLIGRATRAGWLLDKRLATAAALLAPLVLAAGSSRNRRGKAAAALAFVSCAAVGMQVTGYRATSPWQRPVQEVMPAIRWLNAHTAPRSVVLSTPLVSSYLVAHGHNAVYFCDYGMDSPPSVYHDRALRLLAFLGVDRNALGEALDRRSPRFDPTLKFSFFYWRSFQTQPGVFLDRGRFLRAYTPIEIEAVVKRLGSIEDSDPGSVLGPYRCDYVLEWRNEWKVLTGARELFFHRDPGKLACLSSVYDDGNVRILAVKAKPWSGGRSGTGG